MSSKIYIANFDSGMRTITPQYDDVSVGACSIRLPSSNPPTVASYKGSEVLSFAKDATNTLPFTVQLPHSYKEETNIELHLHVAWPTNGAGDVLWRVTYSWANVDSAFPTETSVDVLKASPAVLDRHELVELIATISGTSKAISSVLLGSISRVGGDGGDTYDNSIYLASVDFHIQKDGIGSFLAESKD